MNLNELRRVVCKAITDGLKANDSYTYQEPADCFCEERGSGWTYNYSQHILDAIEEACRNIDFPSGSADEETD